MCQLRECKQNRKDPLLPEPEIEISIAKLFGKDSRHTEICGERGGAVLQREDKVNQAQSVLLKLVRCARCQKTAVGDPETDRSAVFTEASIQTVTALAAKALHRRATMRNGRSGKTRSTLSLRI